MHKQKEKGDIANAPVIEISCLDQGNLLNLLKNNAENTVKNMNFHVKNLNLVISC